MQNPVRRPDSSRTTPETSPPVEDEIVAQVSRDIILQVRPEELPVYRAHAEAYLKDPGQALSQRQSKEAMLAFGIAEAGVFLTPVVLAVLSEVVAFLKNEVKEVVKGEAKGAIGVLVKQLFTKFRLEKDDPSLPPPLSLDQVARIRTLAVEKARHFDLSEERAALLADALVGSLVTATRER